MPNEQHPLADKILHRIEDERLTPKPRWRFSLWNGFWWTLWVVVILLGACVAAAMVFVFANEEWTYRVITHGTTLNFLLDVLPIIWIVLLAAAIFIGYENIRKTKLGYRYPFASIVLLTLAGTLVGGFLLHAVGVGESIEQRIGQYIPHYRPTIDRNRDRWMNPARGFIVGEITDRATDGSSVSLQSFDGRTWTLPLTELPPHGRDVLMRFDDVRVVGLPFQPTDATGTQTFHPCFAFPWDERHDLFSPSHRPPHGLPPPDRNINIGSTTSCQRIASFPSLRGIQDQQLP